MKQPFWNQKRHWKYEISKNHTVFNFTFAISRWIIFEAELDSWWALFLPSCKSFSDADFTICPECSDIHLRFRRAKSGFDSCFIESWLLKSDFAKISQFLWKKWIFKKKWIYWKIKFRHVSLFKIFQTTLFWLLASSASSNQTYYLYKTPDAETQTFYPDPIWIQSLSDPRPS